MDISRRDNACPHFTNYCTETFRATLRNSTSSSLSDRFSPFQKFGIIVAPENVRRRNNSATQETRVLNTKTFPKRDFFSFVSLFKECGWKSRTTSKNINLWRSKIKFLHTIGKFYFSQTIFSQKVWPFLSLNKVQLRDLALRKFLILPSDFSLRS